MSSGFDRAQAYYDNQLPPYLADDRPCDECGAPVEDHCEDCGDCDCDSTCNEDDDEEDT